MLNPPHCHRWPPLLNQHSHRLIPRLCCSIGIAGGACAPDTPLRGVLWPNLRVAYYTVRGDFLLAPIKQNHATEDLTSAGKGSWLPLSPRGPVRPPSPRNHETDESDTEEDDGDSESLLATQPPDIAFTATASMPPDVFANTNEDYQPPDDLFASHECVGKGCRRG